MTGTRTTKSSKGQANEIEELQETIGQLKEVLDNAVARVKQVEEENKKLKHRFDTLENGKAVKFAQKDMEKLVEETVKRESFADMLKKNIKTKPRQVIQQMADLQDRRYNLVFCGIEESKEENNDAKKAYDQDQIKNVAKQAGLPKSFHQAVVACRRLGKKLENHNHRPLLVRLNSQDLREQALRGNRQLKEFNRENAEQGHVTRFKIDPDLSREQRDVLNKKWEEAKEKSKNGKTYIVVGKEQPFLKCIVPIQHKE